MFRDRKDIHELYPTGMSTHPSNISAPWKNDPTPIQPPSNNPRRSTDATNPVNQGPPKRSNLTHRHPYTLERMSSTLGQRQSGNLTAKSTMTNHHPLRKKAKIDYKGKNRELPLIAPEVINVDEDVEGDYPMHDASSDELNIIGSHSHKSQHSGLDSRVQRPSKCYISVRSCDCVLTSFDTGASTSRLPIEGDNTEWLMGQIVQPTISGERVRSDSPIEQFEEEHPTRIHVRRIAGQYERRGFTPHIDFNNVRKSIKNNMKGKLGRPEHPTKPFTKPLRSKPPENAFAKPSSYRLPLAACYIGFKRIPDETAQQTPLYLSWTDRQLELFIINAQDETCSVLTLESRHLANIECTDDTIPLKDSSDPPIVKISTALGPPIVIQGFGSDIQTSFRAGCQDGMGNITLKMDLQNREWKQGIYKALLEWLKGPKIPMHRTRGGKQLWEVAKASAEMYWRGSEQGTRTSNCHGLPVQERRITSVEDQTSQSLTKQSLSDVRVLNDAPALKSSSKPIDTSKSRGIELRRSSRQLQLEAQALKKSSPIVDPDEVILVYPQGVPGAINITNADVKRLEPGEFLNDTVIEFGLKFPRLWLKELEASNPSLADQVHVFSSFFYKKLNKRNFEEGYESVKKWTSKINIFEKKCIIVPINEHLHWYLAIIYMPEHILLPPPPETQKVSPASRTRSQKGQRLKQDKDASDLSNDKLAIIPSADTVNECDIRGSLDEFHNSCVITIANGTDNAVSDNVAQTDPVLMNDLRTSASPVDFDISMEIDRSEEEAVRKQLRLPSPTVSDLSEPYQDDQDEPSRPISAQNDDGGPDNQSHFVTSRYFSNNPKTPIFRRSTEGDDDEVARGQPMEFDCTIDVEDEIQNEVVKPDSKPTTYIFTLDSLGSRHPQAIKQLSRYLVLEARDKRNALETSPPVGRPALVPTQPNYCDCGIYLLHFAQTFMTDPEKYCKIINKTHKATPASERRIAWEEQKIGNMREELAERIKQLSREWQKDRALKEETKKDDINITEVSDDEIEYVETAPATGQIKSKTNRSGSSKKSKQEKAIRLRD
ncbi:hypothetical protein AMATHDRAFT_44951 [Amanita thiersii Skay4041]|uniref:Ubiquitin-like protease family profile domain-containing protein n=1 Tax=Amanita thiersii Skay4041 TaxID=703135 RepID=A0A2A9NUW9_9AGAR|nr:hypothetical protein AMATHDRAFT_44951 [Amanita thiersii Skay4041]